MTIREIREDLREIRYYYGMSDLFKIGEQTIAPQAVLDKVDKYNKVISKAPAKLYAVYIGLYVYNNTQVVLAEDWGYTNEYVHRLNNKLCEFFKKQFEKQSG